MQAASTQLIQDYYDAFNRQDVETFLDLLTDDVIHDINQSARQIGKPAFATFMAEMNHDYRENVRDIVVMTSADGSRASAEFVVHGSYLNTMKGLPEALGQHYILPAGAFFDIREGKVARVTNYYNLSDWIDQVKQ